ncbi:MAG: phenylacetate-CoA oxygenase, PaaI subunit [Marmoricola sp.]|nr:phenylacetate-CoA oxygenase, PaaI subunit [Marmoricola sp.]
MSSRFDARSRSVLGLADDALIASHRLSEWVARAPQLEEDIALANVALDLLGQARLLLAHAGQMQVPALNEDQLAYERPIEEFRNAVMLERPNGDFAATMARMLLFSAYQYQLYSALSGCADPELAAIAGKAVKEVEYHRDHAAGWVVRLGDGTEESHQRMQSGLDAEWPGFTRLFVDWIRDDVIAAGQAIFPPWLREPVVHWLEPVLERATLVRPEITQVREPGIREPGRNGAHTDDLIDILAQMREVRAAHPGASW